MAVIFGVLLLSSCRPVTPVPPAGGTETRAPVPTTARPLPTRYRGTATAAGNTPARETTAVQATSPPSTLTPAPETSAFLAPDGLKIAFVFEGNLYIQDSSDPPRQLTAGGNDWYPIFSDDGEKLVFFRGVVPHDLYAVDVDGSQEQALVSADLLHSLGYRDSTELRSLAFLPGSHRLLFNTHELDPLDIKMKDQNRRGARPNNDLLVVDAETGHVTPILPPGQGGRFLVSPEGNLVAVLAEGHVDVVGVDGNMVYRNLVAYTPSRPVALEPYLYWLPDSTGLLVLLPVETDYQREGPATYAVRRYSLDGSAAVRVPLEPPLTDAGLVVVSPDRQWILYNRLVDGALASLQVGNLGNGRSREYGPPASSQSWSPDSLHFVYDVTGEGLYLGRLDDSPTFLAEGIFLGWIDARRYLYVERDKWTLVLGDIEREAVPLFYDVPSASLSNGRNFFTFVYPGDGAEEGG